MTIPGDFPEEVIIEPGKDRGLTGGGRGVEEGPATRRRLGYRSVTQRPFVLPGSLPEEEREQPWAKGEAGLRDRISEGLCQPPGSCEAGMAPWSELG